MILGGEKGDFVIVISYFWGFVNSLGLLWDKNEIFVGMSLGKKILQKMLVFLNGLSRTPQKSSIFVDPFAPARLREMDIRYLRTVEDAGPYGLYIFVVVVFITLPFCILQHLTRKLTFYIVGTGVLDGP